MIEESGVNNLLSSSSQAQDASTVQDMGELLASVEDMKPLRRGDVVEGIVMRADADGILVSIGHKAEGIVPAREMRTLIPEDFERLKVGDELELNKLLPPLSSFSPDILLVLLEQD